MKLTLRILSLLAVAGASSAFGQTTIFSDNFGTLQNDTYTSSGAIEGSAWTTSRSGGDFGARRSSTTGQLELTNDISATTNVAGWAYASVSLASFSSPFQPILSSNEGVLSWSFNMRQIRTDPAGFSSGNYGVAFVLAGSSTTVNNAGSGYAVVLGQSGSTDPVRLVTYNNGLAGTLSNLITATSPIADVGSEYLSIKVTYNPATNAWTMEGRSDGASAFADPQSGILTSFGSAVVNSTYTSLTMTTMGAYWQGSTGAGQTAFFDNVLLTSAVPEPSSFAALAGVGALGFCALRRRRSA